jgi:hypothetical protein
MAAAIAAAPSSTPRLLDLRFIMRPIVFVHPVGRTLSLFAVVRK